MRCPTGNIGIWTKFCLCQVLRPQRSELPVVWPVQHNRSILFTRTLEVEHVAFVGEAGYPENKSLCNLGLATLSICDYWNYVLTIYPNWVRTSNITPIISFCCCWCCLHLAWWTELHKKSTWGRSWASRHYFHHAGTKWYSLYLDRSPSSLVGLPIKDEAINVARCELHEAHYHGRGICLFTLLGIKKRSMSLLYSDVGLHHLSSL